jgi:hypothetical protein
MSSVLDSTESESEVALCGQDIVSQALRRWLQGSIFGSYGRKRLDCPKVHFPKGFHKQLEVFGACQINKLALNGGGDNSSSSGRP